MNNGLTMIVGLSLATVSVTNFVNFCISSSQEQEWKEVHAERVSRLRKWCHLLGNPIGKQGIPEFQ